MSSSAPSTVGSAAPRISASARADVCALRAAIPMWSISIMDTLDWNPVRRWAADTSARLVEHLGDRRGDDRLLQPAFEALRLLLGHDALARGIVHCHAASPEHRQHVARSLLGA